MEHYLVPSSNELGDKYKFNFTPAGHPIEISKYFKKDLSDIPGLPTETLRNMAKRIGIRGRSTMNKATLVEEVRRRIVFES